MPYVPRPLDTSGVVLTDEVAKLTEALAENAHESWAERRLRDGWTWGPERNDTRREHPCLVPYNELPESEREYDRVTAMGAIRAIIALEYAIVPPDRQASISIDVLAAEDEAMANVIDFLRDPPALDASVLLALWRNRRRDAWGRHPDAHRLLGERLLNLGEPLVAYDVLDDGIAHWPTDVRMRQLAALALARSGATERAQALLDVLIEEGHNDTETLGIYARTHKDLAERASDPRGRRRHLRRAFNAYEHAWRPGDAYWTGINAATLALLLDDERNALALARQVREQAYADLPADDCPKDAYWPLATLGEAALILGDLPQARDWYGKAVEAGRGRFGDISSTRRNARLILGHRGEDRNALDDCFAIPPIYVFAGPVRVGSDAAVCAFAFGSEPPAAALRARLGELDMRIGYAAISGTADVEFAEVMQECRGESHVVIPYERDQFLRDIGALPGGTAWAERCARALDRATTIVTASENRRRGTPMMYAYATRAAYGLATIHAGQLDTPLLHLTPIASASGPESFRLAPVDADAYRETARTNSVADDEPLRVEVKAMLFADAKGFGNMADEAIPLFIEHFLGLVARVVERSSAEPLVRNTWGDGLFMVFADERAAATFALDLRDAVRGTKWPAVGLPETLTIRIALHAGPVYHCIDPVTGANNCFGAHVSRAARIEPITPPGEVYASQAFAALLALSGDTGFVCSYVGNMPWAKEYGSFPTYHVRRAGG